MQELTFVSEQTLSQAQFLEWLATTAPRDKRKYEFIRGRVVVTPPAGWPHGRLEVNLSRPMEEHASRTGAGMVLGSSTGYILPTGDLLEPDISFISKQRWEAGPKPALGEFLRIVPDFVVEILSPSNRRRDIEEKLPIYEAAGVLEYWMLDLDARMVIVYRSTGKGFGAPEHLGPEASVGSTAVRDFEIAVKAIFTIPS